MRVRFEEFLFDDDRRELMRSFPLRQGENLLGRGEDADVRVGLAGVSRLHARITVSGDRATIEDLGSKNGTFVDEAEIGRAAGLRDGAILRLGVGRRLIGRWRVLPRRTGPRRPGGRPGGALGATPATVSAVDVDGSPHSHASQPGDRPPGEPDAAVWEGVDLEQLARSTPTPFFLFSEARLGENLDGLRSGLTASGLPVRLRYCAKANGELAILQILAAAGLDVLVSHAAEGELALRAGFPPQRMALQKPVLTAADAAWAVQRRVGLVHACREQDLDTLAAAAAATGHAPAVSLRVGGDAHGSPLAFANRRLGVSRRQALRLGTGFRRWAPLRLRALNCYIGTQQTGTAGFRQAIARLCRLAVELRQEGVEVEELNLGGGAPSPTMRRLAPGRLLSRWRDVEAGEQRPSVESFARRLGEIVAAAWRRHDLDATALALEPGRSLVGDAAVLVTRVAAVDRGWLFLDVSRNVLGESSLLLRRRVLPLRPRAGKSRYYHLSGGTLNTMDVLDLHRRLPPMEVGDLLLFADAGAYSLSRAARYGGLSPAALLRRASGEIVTVRRAETLDDLTGPMVPLPR
ncbi:MAG TPA: FHA domain-containing protein [Thermoanaerobaculia bacterium]|nr:FHA domain-containing protein [Thermoanaerobaculia bacterium]